MTNERQIQAQKSNRPNESAVELTQHEWCKVHKDYKTVLDGVLMLLVCENGASVLKEVQLIEGK
jgi:hypothetical protein